MGSPELAQYADFYADMTRRFGLTDSLELWRDISERLHQLTPEPEDVTYREVTANGVPAILVMPARQLDGPHPPAQPFRRLGHRVNVAGA
jgi:hypothetical protein